LGLRRESVDALRSFQRIGFDTPVFVYHIEQSSRWAATASAALEAMVDGRFAGMTSVLTLLEISIKPLRLGRPEVADAYEARLEISPIAPSVMWMCARSGSRRLARQIRPSNTRFIADRRLPCEQSRSVRHQRPTIAPCEGDRRGCAGRICVTWQTVRFSISGKWAYAAIQRGALADEARAADVASAGLR